MADRLGAGGPARTVGLAAQPGWTPADRQPPARPRRRQARVEVIGLATHDTYLRELVEHSQPASTARCVPALSPVDNGGPPAAPGQRPPDTGVLVLSPRGHARYALEQLTDRERDVLALMAEGRSNHAIADLLFVTEHTIEKHIKNIFAALRLAPSRTDHRRVLAVLTYLTAVAAG